MNMPLTKPIPLLKEGDRLTRDEFERRYETMPGLHKAELIDGVVFMPSPVRYDQHAQQHADTVTWLGIYRIYTPGVGLGVNASVRLDMKNEPQPDGVMFKEHGGNVRIVDGYVTDAPDLAAEVSASTLGVDLGGKFQIYRRNGVREYIVWRVLDNEIDWFVLRGDQYVPLTPDEAGVFRSETFPGLWLDREAMLEGDMLRVNDTLQQGLRTPEHAAFVAELQRAKK